MEQILSIITLGAYPGASVAEYLAVAFWIWVVVGWVWTNKGERLVAVLTIPLVGIVAFPPTFLVWAMLSWI